MEYRGEITIELREETPAEAGGNLSVCFVFHEGRTKLDRVTLYYTSMDAGGAEKKTFGAAGMDACPTRDCTPETLPAEWPEWVRELVRAHWPQVSFSCPGSH